MLGSVLLITFWKASTSLYATYYAQSYCQIAEIFLCKQFHKLIALMSGTHSPGVVSQMSGNQILSNLIECNPCLSFTWDSQSNKIKQTFIQTRFIGRLLLSSAIEHNQTHKKWLNLTQLFANSRQVKWSICFYWRQ